MRSTTDAFNAVFGSKRGLDASVLSKSGPSAQSYADGVHEAFLAGNEQLFFAALALHADDIKAGRATAEIKELILNVALHLSTTYPWNDHLELVGALFNASGWRSYHCNYIIQDDEGLLHFWPGGALHGRGLSYVEDYALCGIAIPKPKRALRGSTWEASLTCPLCMDILSSLGANDEAAQAIRAERAEGPHPKPFIDLGPPPAGQPLLNGRTATRINKRLLGQPARAEERMSEWLRTIWFAPLRESLALAASGLPDQRPMLRRALGGAYDACPAKAHRWKILNSLSEFTTSTPSTNKEIRRDAALRETFHLSKTAWLRVLPSRRDLTDPQFQARYAHKIHKELVGACQRPRRSRS